MTDGIHDGYAPRGEEQASRPRSAEQAAYEAYRAERRGYSPQWDALPLHEQMAWMAAADAAVMHAAVMHAAAEMAPNPPWETSPARHD